jgi:DNA-binding CsgD family transcriptional regulator
LWTVRAALLSRRGAIGDACALYEKIWELARTGNVREPCAVLWARDATEAFVAAGRAREAAELCEWIASAAEQLPCRWPRLVVAVATAELAERERDAERAEASYREALELQEGLEMPLEADRTLLAYGRFLRRTGRPRAARPLLAQALRVAEQAGAGWLEGEAREELHAAGGRRRRQRGRFELSTMEARTARLAEQGLTNREIGRQLGISGKTVESHLRSVYRKLNVRSRRELIVLRSHEPRLDGVGTQPSSKRPRE